MKEGVDNRLFEMDHSSPKPANIDMGKVVQFEIKKKPSYAEASEGEDVAGNGD